MTTTVADSSSDQARPTSRPSLLAHLRTTPGRIVAAAGLVVALAGIAAGLIASFSAGAGGGLRSISGQDAPEVTATTGLYFSLNDMDAQVANLLLVGTDPALTADKTQDQSIYQQDRATADQDLQQAAVIAAGNPAAQRELQSVLGGLGQFEAFAAEALVTDQQSASPAGRPSEATLVYYQQATDVMAKDVLPQVAALTGVSAASVDGSYSSGRSDALTGFAVALAAGLMLVSALVLTQVYVARRCRRRVNPALAAATLIALVLVAASSAQFSAEASHLKVAKKDAFDSILALTQARAVSYDANADESRYLVDTGRAATYQQAFLGKSQRLVDVGQKIGIFQYDAALAADIKAYQANNSDVRFGGYMGTEFRNITFPGERAAAERTLLAYQVYERDDRQLRAMAPANLRSAIAFDIGTAPGQSDYAFSQYSTALTSLITINQNAFVAAVNAGIGDTAAWTGAVPGACAALIALLVIVGVRPRLAEYR